MGLREFCASTNWRPVYLDEVSVVFVRRQPETEDLIRRFEVDCQTAPLPAAVPIGDRMHTFNQWANAAAVLKVLGRNQEAFAAAGKALAIFPDTAYVRYMRAELLAQVGDLPGAEAEYLNAANIEPNPRIWVALAKMYDRERRLNEAIPAWKRVVDLTTDPYLTLLSLGYDYLDVQQPEEALRTFDKSSKNLPETLMGTQIDKSYYANLAHGRAMAWKALGDFKQAVTFEEETLRITPDRADDWRELAGLYDHEGRSQEAQRALERAAVLERPDGK